MSMMVSFVLSFFPRDVLDEILNLIESVSEDFPSYPSTAGLIGRVFQSSHGEAQPRIHDLAATFCIIIESL